MCGVVGFYREVSSEELDSLAGKCLDTIAHRGPDHSAYWKDQSVCFGHTRLKIVDLSARADQPYVFEHLVLSFNGEIYNFLDLRTALKKEGYLFDTESDTEVVIKAYHCWGNRCFEKLDGMFAIALYDQAQRQIILARDIFGKKPLYFSTAGGFTFCSELNAFRVLIRDLSLNNVALNHILGIGYVLEPLTIYEQVEALPPSSFLEYSMSTGLVRIQAYYHYADAFRHKNRLSKADIIDHTRELLLAAVSRRLMGDVPMGIFLSGGIDSGGIVSVIHRFHNKDFPCYTVGFSDSVYDELYHAATLADALDLEHHTLNLSEIDREDFGQYLNKADYVTFDNSAYPIFKMAQMASHKVKFVLTGDGSDEVFGGYPTYIADDLNRRLRWIIPFLRSSELISGLNKRLKQKNDKVGLRTKISRFISGADPDARVAHYRWREIYNEEERIALLGEQYREMVYDTSPLKGFIKRYDVVPDLDIVDQHLYVDAFTWLSCNNLVKIDRNTMRAGIEARSPYLDKDLTAFVASCPVHYKRQKHLLKEVLSDFLPKEVLQRRKTGFNAPVGRWFEIDGNEFEFYTRMVFDHIKSANG